MQYTSKSQLARVNTEAWVTLHGYCLAFQSNRLTPTRANTQARDFECPSCGHPYELKSTSKSFGQKVVDGAYAPMIRRIEDGTVPSFLLLRYSQASLVTDLVAVHRTFITREVIQERKPLSITAKRAGWVGCNLLLSAIPPEGLVPFIRNSLPCLREATRSIFVSVEQLRTKTLESRSWSRSLLACLHRLPQPRFTLVQAYAFEHELSSLYPGNNNVRQKIRQQLQVLRDAGLLTFEKRGVYQLGYTTDPNGVFLYGR